MIAEASRVLRPGGILAYSLLNPFWRVADLAQYRLRRGLPLQLPELVKRGRHLGDPSGDFERLRRRGLVPFSLQGSMVLPGLRRSETFLKRAPLLRGGWTRFAWDVVVSGARPIGRSDVALDRDSQRYMDALDGGKKCVFSTESEACSVVPLSTCRPPRSGQEYLFIQPDGLRVGRLKAQERTASGDAFCFDSAWLPVWRNGILGEVLLGTRRDVRR